VADLVVKGLYMSVQYIRCDRSDQQDLVPTNNLLFMGHINFISDHFLQSYHNVKINEIPLFGVIIIYYIINFLHNIDDTFNIFTHAENQQLPVGQMKKKIKTKSLKRIFYGF